MSIAVGVAEASGSVMRKIYESGELHMKDKGGNDPVTIADFTVQKTIETNFKHFFPSLITQGEESQDCLDDIESAVKPEELNDEWIKIELLENALQKRIEFNQYMRDTVYGDEILESFSQFSTEKAVVWIDPLDGTKEFINGNLSAVTVLIGLAIDGKPKLGVVHHPFKSNENDGNGMTLFAT